MTLDRNDCPVVASSSRMTMIATMAMRPFQVSALFVQPQDQGSTGAGRVLRSLSYASNKVSRSPAFAVQNKHTCNQDRAMVQWGRAGFRGPCHEHSTVYQGHLCRHDVTISTGYTCNNGGSHGTHAHAPVKTIPCIWYGAAVHCQTSLSKRTHPLARVHCCWWALQP